MPPSCRKKSRWNLHWNTLENYKSLLKPDRCRHTAITKGSASSPAQIPRTTQPTIQNHLRRHLPSSTSTTLYSTLLSTNPTLHSTTQFNSTQLQPIIRYSVPSLRQGRRPHRSVGSTPRISPPEGWRMNPGHRSTLK